MTNSKMNPFIFNRHHHYRFITSDHPFYHPRNIRRLSSFLKRSYAPLKIYSASKTAHLSLNPSS